MIERLLLGIGAAATSAAVVAWVRGRAPRRGWLDLPNARSGHEVPTPRGGGWGILASFLLAAALAPRYADAAHVVLAAGAAAVVLVALVGWIDDLRDLAIAPRIAAHAAAGVGLAFVAVAASPEPFGIALPASVVWAWWIFWTVSTVNVVNFLDGTDGLIGVQAVVFSAFVLALGPPAGETARWLAAALLGGSIGFLVFNWSPASVFLGDVGSGAVAAIFVLIGSLALESGVETAFHAFLPLAPMFVDEVTTMARRARRGERLWVAHRTHVYQRLVDAGWSDRRVAVVYGALSAAAGAWAWSFPRADGAFYAGLGVLVLATGACLEALRARARRRVPVGSR